MYLYVLPLFSINIKFIPENRNIKAVLNFIFPLFGIKFKMFSISIIHPKIMIKLTEIQVVIVNFSMRFNLDNLVLKGAF